MGGCGRCIMDLENTNKKKKHDGLNIAYYIIS
jgi:hypothetical protein